MSGYRELGQTASTIAILVALAGCGASRQQPPPISPASLARTGVLMDSSALPGPLVYVAHVRGRGSHSYDVVSIVALKDGRTVARITGYGYTGGMCSDESGDVWISNLRHGHWYVDKFARGGTKAIEELRAPRRWIMLVGCAVDPTSGDLAVAAANFYGYPYVLVWSGGHQGNPAHYPAPFPPLYAVYDHARNLFITGWYGGSDFFFEMGVLANGSSQVTKVQLDRRVGKPGDVQWDGKYVVVATDVGRHNNRTRPRLYRVQVSGTSGHVVQAIQPDGLYKGYYPATLFVLQGRTAIGMGGSSGELLSVWPYPAGGKPARTVAHFKAINGLAISK